MEQSKPFYRLVLACLSRPVVSLGHHHRGQTLEGEGAQAPPLWMRIASGVMRRLLLLPLLMVITMGGLVYGTTHNWAGLSLGSQTSDNRPLTPASLGLYYRDVTMVTDDDVKLSAWHIPVWSANRLLRGDVDRSLRTRLPAVVLVHGAWSDRSQMLHLAPALHAAGYELLLVDLRGCGQSDGNTRLGLEEWRDIQASVEWLQQAGPVDPRRIAVVSTEASSGAAIRAAAQNNAIRAVVADRPCQDVSRFLRQRFRSMGLPGGTLGRLYEWSFSLGTASDLSEGSARQWAAKMSPEQALLVSARSEDEQIPSGDPLIVLEASPSQKRLWISPFPQETSGQPAILPGRLIEFLEKNM